MPQGRKKTSIEKLPVEVRKKILWVAVTLIMIIVVIFWLFSITSNISKIETTEGGEKLAETADQLGEVIFQTQENFKGIKEEAVTLLSQIGTTTPTSSQKLSAEQVELIKQQLEKTSAWQTYVNDQYKFEVRYPTDWHFKEDIAQAPIYLYGIGFNPNDTTDQDFESLLFISDQDIETIQDYFKESFGELKILVNTNLYNNIYWHSLHNQERTILWTQRSGLIFISFLNEDMISTLKFIE